MDAGIAIDNIKSLIKQAQGGNDIKLHPGDGIGVSRTADGYRVSSLQNESDQPRALTFKVCINGVPKNIDIFIARDPYPIS
jgi:hypothetical protein